MKKILIFLASFIIGISNIPATQPTEITTPKPVITGELKLGGEELGVFEHIPASKVLYSAGPDLKELPELITRAYTFSDELKDKINGLIVDLYGTNGRLAVLHQNDAENFSQLTNHIAEMELRIENTLSRVENDINILEDKTLVEGYDYSYNSANVSKTSGYIDIPFSYLLNNHNKVISGYLNKKDKPNLVGYHLYLDVAHNDSRIIPGKVYKCFFTCSGGPMSLVVRNRNLVQSAPRVFIQGGSSADYDFTWFDDKNSGISYGQYVCNKFRDYRVEIEASANQFYVTISQGSASLWAATATADLLNVPINSFTKSGIPALGSTPKLNGPRGSWGWATEWHNDKTVDKRLALTVTLPSSARNYETIRGTISYQAYTWNNGTYSPKIYTYNSDGSQAGSVDFETACGVALPFEQTVTIKKTIILKRSATRTYKAYIRAKARSGGSNYKGFHMRISNIENLVGNPQ